MASPLSASRTLRSVAASLVSQGPAALPAALEELSKVAADIDSAGPVKLKLISTEPSLDETADETTYYQEWVLTLPDGTKIQTSTDVGWGQEPFGVPHGDTEVDVCGHSMSVEEILGFVISTGDGPVEDGEEVALDGEWCSRMSEAGHLG